MLKSRRRPKRSRCEAAPDSRTRGVLPVRRACGRGRQRSRWAFSAAGSRGSSGRTRRRGRRRAPERRRDIGVAAPLADRMRPRSLDEVVGQEHLLGPGRVLRAAIESGQLHSMILWGPPGSGKDHARLADGLGGRRPLRGVLRSALRGEGDPRGRRRRRYRAPPPRRPDHPLRGRDPSLQSRPAGRLPPARREGDGGPRGGHHRESVVRGQRGLALALPGLRPARPHRRPARRDSEASPDRPRARPGPPRRRGHRGGARPDRASGQRRRPGGPHHPGAGGGPDRRG